MANVFQAASGYRGPNKAMTVKALEARQKAADEALATSMQPTVVADPTQGIAGVLGVLGAQMGQGRADREASVGRADLASAMAGIDMDKGPDMATLAHIATRDPELAKSMYDQAMAARQATKLQEGRQTFEHGENVLTREGTASESAKTREGEMTRLNDQQAATAEENRLKAEQDVAAATTLAERQAAEKRLEEASAASEAAAKDSRAVAETKRQEQERPTTEVGKIDDDYNKGKYGVVGSPEAIKQRDDAIAAQNAKGRIKPSEMFTPGQSERDKVFAKDLVEWEQSGGPNAVKSLSEANAGIQHLISGSKNGWIDPTGLAAGIANRTLPDVVSKWINPEGEIAKAAIRSTIMTNLRQVLGAQFTENEGERMMKQSFDPDMPPAENLRRAKLILDQISTIAQNKQIMAKHFYDNGTLADYKGTDLGEQIGQLASLTFDDQGSGTGTGTGSGTPAPPKRVTVRERTP